jgi:hypothetical protein
VSFTAELPPHMAESWQQFQWHLLDVPEDPFDPEAEEW